MNPLVLSNISKGFGGVQALAGASLTCYPGEVHGLIGENGAGKSSLVKVLAGAVRPETGDISLDGSELHLRSPAEAAQRGIGTVFQELSLIPDLSVAANLYYGIEPKTFGRRIAVGALNRSAQRTLMELGLSSIPAARTVRELSLADRQLVEIAKVLLREPRVLLLDESTSSLLPDQVEWLFARAREVAARGSVVLFISHRLEEIQALCDRVTVLRAGVDVGSGLVGEMPEWRLVELMLGRKVERFYPARRDLAQERPEAFCVLTNFGAPPRLQGVDLTVRHGEIVGVGGLAGQGQLELFQALYGARRSSGKVQMEGQTVRLRSPAEALGAGIALIPEDRATDGLCLSLSVRDNISLSSLGGIATFGLIRRGRERVLTDSAIDHLRIQVRDSRQEVGALSGGNQQKVLLGRALAQQPRLLLLYDATRGVDVGTKAEIYQLIREQCASGVGVLFYSTDAAELANLADRVYVIHDGAIRLELSADDLTERKIVAASVGGLGQESDS